MTGCRVRRVSCFGGLGLYSRLVASFAPIGNGRPLFVSLHGDLGFRPYDIVYVHFPITLLVEGPWAAYTKYYRGFWRAYFEPYRALQNMFLKLGLHENSVLIANSSFTASLAEHVYGRRPIVVHPPAPIDRLLATPLEQRRYDCVVVLSRFSPEKMLHILPVIAAKLRNIDFHVVGRVAGVAGKKVFLRLKRFSHRLENLHLHPNAPEEEKIRLLMKCKVLLHLMPYEHFGIAVVEGIAAGLIPAVPACGGVWTDVVCEGRYGVGFEKLHPDQIVEAVVEALSRWSPEQATVNREYSKRFRPQVFHEKFARIVDIVARYKYA